MPENLVYRSQAIADHYGSNRRHWHQFYRSECWIMDQVAAQREGDLGRVLDVGCACGGLGAALSERGLLKDYTGIDINAQAIDRALEASDISVPHRFIAGDVATTGALASEGYDTVFSLGCADWNLDTQGILAAAWRHVAPGGTLIISLRLTERAGERRLDRSFQYIHFEEPAALSEDAERAAYVVLNVTEALAMLGELAPSRITGYGNWGKPSFTARTPYDRLAFTVFAIDKPSHPTEEPPALALRLPWDLWRKPPAGP